MNPDQNAQNFNSADHDLIVEIKTELRLFREESRNSNDYAKEQLIKLGENKLEKDAFITFVTTDSSFKADHELRVRRLETWGLMGIGGLFVIQLLVGWYLIFRH